MWNSSARHHPLHSREEVLQHSTSKKLAPLAARDTFQNWETPSQCSDEPYWSESADHDELGHHKREMRTQTALHTKTDCDAQWTENDPKIIFK